MKYFIRKTFKLFYSFIFTTIRAKPFLLNEREKILKLSKSNIIHDRATAARSKYADDLLLEVLSKDKNHYIRLLVASNRNTPINILQNLTNDENAYVRSNAEHFLRLYFF